jgi:2'-5' RNA ligase
VERAAEAQGFARQADEEERRPFRAHVTVGRCKRRIDARRALSPWRARQLGSFTVAELHVYESILGGAGSTYVLRGRAPLGGAGGA